MIDGVPIHSSSFGFVLSSIYLEDQGLSRLLKFPFVSLPSRCFETDARLSRRGAYGFGSGGLGANCGLSEEGNLGPLAQLEELSGAGWGLAMGEQ